MKKKIILILLSSLMLTSCGFLEHFSSEEALSFSSSVNEDVSSYSPLVFNNDENWEKSDSKIYTLNEEDKNGYSVNDLPTYFYKDYPSVPYIQLMDFLRLRSDEEDYYTEDNGVFTYMGAQMQVDDKKDTLTFSDYDRFVTYYYYGVSAPTDLGGLYIAREYNGKPEDKLETSYKKGKELTLDLSSYHCDILLREGKVFIPFAYVNEIFCNPNYEAYAFNGSDYFDMTSPSALYTVRNVISTDGMPHEEQVYDLTPYGKMVYKNRKEQHTRNEEYASYFYYSTCFHFDYMYGRKDEESKSMNQRAEESSLKDKMLSKDAREADYAFAEFLGQHYDDGGHTGFVLPGNGVSLSAENDAEGQTYFEKGLSASLEQRYIEGNAIGSELTELRKRKAVLSSFYMHTVNEKDGKVKSLTGYNIFNDLGIIRFDNFDDSSTLLFKKAFSEFRKNSSIRNVVIDLSLNGGGYVKSAVEALSFLHSGITLNYQNTVSSSLTSETVELSKIKSYEGEYNFYILVSGYTFSAANAFACIAEDKGYASIIGQENSGGGECAVGNCTLADGTTFMNSSCYRFVNADNEVIKSIDKGAEPDYRASYDSYYDYQKLAELING